MRKNEQQNIARRYVHPPSGQDAAASTTPPARRKTAVSGSRKTSPITSVPMVYARAECNHPRTKLDNVFQQDRSNELTAPGQFDCAMSPATQPNRTAMHSSAELTESNSVPLYTLEVTEIAALTQFFEILDRWDREAHPNTEYVLADADQAA